MHLTGVLIVPVCQVYILATLLVAMDLNYKNKYFQTGLHIKCRVGVSQIALSDSGNFERNFHSQLMKRLTSLAQPSCSRKDLQQKYLITSTEYLDDQKENSCRL